MDAVAIIIGIAMFAILIAYLFYALIRGENL
jgi:K+-transporting ATPase KdpF subunit